MTRDRKNHDRNWILTWQNVEHLMEQGDFKHALPVGEATTLVYSNKQLSVILELESDEDLTTLPVLPQALKFEPNNSESTLSIVCLDPKLNQYFYAFISEALEQIKFHNSSAVSALLYSWLKLRELIEQEAIMSREKQLGLIGELLFLKLIASLPGWTWKSALDAWHNEAISEHDFALPSVDVEVKCTSQERRVHMIGSVNQLRESPNRRLYMASYHVTSAPIHARESFSLSRLTVDILGAVNGDSTLGDRFLSRLEKAGWCSDHNSFYERSFVHRSDPKLCDVGPGFPRIVPTTLANMAEGQIARIDSVVYSIDITGMGIDMVPSSINAILKEGM